MKFQRLILSRLLTRSSIYLLSRLYRFHEISLSVGCRFSFSTLLLYTCALYCDPDCDCPPLSTIYNVFLAKIIWNPTNDSLISMLIVPWRTCDWKCDKTVEMLSWYEENGFFAFQISFDCGIVVQIVAWTHLNGSKSWRF